MAKRKSKPDEIAPDVGKDYDGLVTGLSGLLDRARTAAARVVNGLMTATYYELGRRIVEFEQGGKQRAEYGERLLKRLATDLTAKHGRGFSRQNLQQMRSFFLDWEICQTVSGIFQIRARDSDAAKLQTVPAISVTLAIILRHTRSVIQVAILRQSDLSSPLIYIRQHCSHSRFFRTCNQHLYGQVERLQHFVERRGAIFR